ncbi:hypothetical protein HN803_07105 [candidate division WWE3 bacterium]|jgi:hypothetical protein|nr:hypothetical protein [candidate division WWE3 bacterium]
MKLSEATSHTDRVKRQFEDDYIEVVGILQDMSNSVVGVTGSKADARKVDKIIRELKKIFDGLDIK